MADIERLYKEHYNFIFRFLMSMSHNEDLAEELTQETFFRAYINIKKLRNDNKSVVWLCQIAKNLYFAWYNEQKKMQSFVHEKEQISSANIERSCEIKILSEQMMRCLALVEEPYNEVFKLHVFGELPLKEISLLYGKSESWARVTFHRAKQKIIERMEENYGM